jgi:NAD(P) transhydrogenase subunit alpha
MYARNVAVYIQNFVKDGVINLSMDDEIIRETVVARDGAVTNPRLRELLGIPAPATV